MPISAMYDITEIILSNSIMYSVYQLKCIKCSFFALNYAKSDFKKSLLHQLPVTKLENMIKCSLLVN